MPDQLKKVGITRRKFLMRSAAAIAGTAAATFGYTWRVEPHWIQVARRSLPIARLPAELVGKTLVQISDLHVGPVVDESYITGAMKRVSELNADILAITGDFMTPQTTEQVGPVMRVLQNLAPGKLATVAILGNHDYGKSWRTPAAADLLTSNLTQWGMRVLRNEVMEVKGGLEIAGMDDYWAKRFNPGPALSNLTRVGAAIALCHNPDALDEPVWQDYRGWILSGHTHGGQCSAPLFGPPVIPVKNRRYTSGEIDLHDGRRVYINRGLGYLHRVRFNARPEITVFRLEKA